jgi:hypothetical protein
MNEKKATSKGKERDAHTQHVRFREMNDGRRKRTSKGKEGETHTLRMSI